MSVRMCLSDKQHTCSKLSQFLCKSANSFFNNIDVFKPFCCLSYIIIQLQRRHTRCSVMYVMLTVLV